MEDYLSGRGTFCPATILEPKAAPSAQDARQPPSFNLIPYIT